MKKLIYGLPYLVMLIITPIYNFLDSKFFVEIFGCGCVPIAQTNMFNIDFNANDLRRVVYFTIAFIMLIFGIVLSKNMENKKTRFIYNLMIIIFNLILAGTICNRFLWN